MVVSFVAQQELQTEVQMAVQPDDASAANSERNSEREPHEARPRGACGGATAGGPGTNDTQRQWLIVTG